MSTYNYANIAATALRLIARFGQAVTITSRVQGTYNAATSAATVTETTQTTRGVLDQYKWREIDGSLVKAGDLKLIVAAKGLSAPAINDSATLADGSKLTIKNIEVVSPGATPIIYICQVRR